MVKNVHRSGALGLLLEKGHVKSIHDFEVKHDGNKKEIHEKVFETNTGIVFKENELIYVHHSECEPWEFANRLVDDMGDMEQLISSIKESQQLQPALVRPHPKPTNGIKYQIIFGRRRHQACMVLDIPFLVINKSLQNDQEAFLAQNDENKHRKDVSNYSNALHYQKLLDQKVFKSAKELAEKLKIKPSSLNELMSFSKMPIDLVKRIPNIHNLSTNMALKINALLAESEDNFAYLLQIADQIGIAISSVSKLENVLTKLKYPANLNKQSLQTRTFRSETGKKLFTFRIDHKGSPTIILNKDLKSNLNFDELLERLNAFLIETKLACQVIE